MTSRGRTSVEIPAAPLGELMLQVELWPNYDCSDLGLF